GDRFGATRRLELLELAALGFVGSGRLRVGLEGQSIAQLTGLREQTLAALAAAARCDRVIVRLEQGGAAIYERGPDESAVEFHARPTSSTSAGRVARSVWGSVRAVQSRSKSCEPNLHAWRLSIADHEQPLNMIADARSRQVAGLESR